MITFVLATPYILVGIGYLISWYTARNRYQWWFNALEVVSQWFNQLHHGKPNETWSSRVGNATRDEDDNYTLGNGYFRFWAMVLGKKHLDWASEPDGD